MRVINLIQNSQEWGEFRRSHVGASDIGIIMTGSKNELETLLEAKLLGKDKFVTKDMQRGKDLESEAREWCNNQYGYNFEPVVGIHDDHEWLMASLDGLDVKEEVILEIKCPREGLLEDHPSYKKWEWQVQAQLAVSGLDRAYILAYGEGFRILNKITRDEKMITKLISEGRKFMDRIEAGELPLLLDSVEDEKTVDLVRRYIHIKDLMESFEKDLVSIKEELIVRNNGRAFRCDTVTVNKTERRGAINYKAVPELKGVDLEPYRNAPVVYWTIEV